MTDSIPFPADADQETRIPADELRAVLVQLLVKNSLFQFDAEIVADRMLEADLRGVGPYGCARILDILDAIRAGDVDPRGRVLTVCETPAAAVLDGSRAVGAVAATRGMELAISKAKEAGIAAVVVGNSQPLGAAGVYALLAARQGMIGHCTTSTGKASVAAPDSALPVIGNSASAWAIPLGDGRAPLVVDAACGPASWGKLASLKKYGWPIPENVLLSAEGGATTDPDAALAMRLDSALRGFGAGLIASVLAGPLAGGKMPLHKKRGPTADDSQHFLQAIDLAQFTDPGRFFQEVNSTLEEIRSAVVDGTAGNLRIPGDRQSHAELQNRRQGIPLHNSTCAALKQAAAHLGINVPW